MSRDLFVSALDFKKLSSIAGSNDEVILTSILEHNSSYLADHDKYFRNFSHVAHYVSLAEAVRQIVQGQVDPGLTPRFQFEHAVALLADTLGEKLDAGLFAESAPAFWDEVDIVIRRRLTAVGQDDRSWPPIANILKRGPYLDIPIDPGWLLGSGYLTADEVRTAASAAQACELQELDETLNGLAWPDDAFDAASQYRDWLRHAAAKKVGLYFHA